MSSTTEGFSIATIEAMACGLPVVVTRSGGPEEIVTHAENGLLVDVASAPQIADAIALIAHDTALKARLAQKARADVVARFSLDAMLRAYENLYAGL